MLSSAIQSKHGSICIEINSEFSLMNSSIAKYSYATFDISVVVPSNYSFSITSRDVARTAVFSGTFYWNNSSGNLPIAETYPSDNGQSELTVFLKPWTSYTLVVAALSPVPLGKLSVMACGSTRFALRHTSKYKLLIN